MNITMDLIKKLREKSGAGIADCKKALEEASGEMEKAIEILRKKGIAKAAKREDREANEGIILVDSNEDNTEAYVLEINSETDFVARNEKFQDLAKNIMKLIKEEKPATVEDLNSLKMESGSVIETVENLSGTIGEKISLKAFNILKGKSVAKYSHMDGKIGVIVSFDKKIDNQLATDIAMQIAATDPGYLNPEDVPGEEVNKEKEIYAEQLRKEGKPEEIIEKILIGKINKYYEEVCLTKQEFIKDDKKKVEEALGDAKIIEYIRYSL
jgi:elongation factor Ts